jgi:hypothetical protein
VGVVEQVVVILAELVDLVAGVQDLEPQVKDMLVALLLVVAMAEAVEVVLDRLV